MRLLLDECVPRRFLRDLSGLDASHVLDEQWSGKTNGELLELLATEGFTVFVTVDQRLPFQQNVSQAAVAVIVLIAKSNRLKDLRPLVNQLRAQLESVVPGQIYRLGA